MAALAMLGVLEVTGSNPVAPTTKPWKIATYDKPVRVLAATGTTWYYRS